MIGLYFLIGALALLIAVLLFGFVGCASFSSSPDPVLPPAPGEPPPPIPKDYADAIKPTADLVAYWRLGEANPPHFPPAVAMPKMCKGCSMVTISNFKPLS